MIRIYYVWLVKLGKNRLQAAKSIICTCMSWMASYTLTLMMPINHCTRYIMNEIHHNHYYLTPPHTRPASYSAPSLFDFSYAQHIRSLIPLYLRSHVL